MKAEDIKPGMLIKYTKEYWDYYEKGARRDELEGKALEVLEVTDRHGSYKVKWTKRKEFCSQLITLEGYTALNSSETFQVFELAEYVVIADPAYCQCSTPTLKRAGFGSVSRNRPGYTVPLRFKP